MKEIFAAKQRVYLATKMLNVTPEQLEMFCKGTLADIEFLKTAQSL